MSTNQQTIYNEPKLLMISIDLDEWYHTRWATGSADSLWKDTGTFFQQYYGTDHPAGEIIAPSHRLLDIFDRCQVKATFFVQGEIAENYPELVRHISERGHEIACHGYHHVDIFSLPREKFIADLKTAKNILEDTTGKPVAGFRAPNLIIEPWVVKVLEDLGFQYDSSVCPSRSLFGKYSGMLNAPLNPYRLSYEALDQSGDSNIIEIPIPTFPIIKLPAATGIMTRVIGKWWTQAALKNALQTGSTMYYFHPYELAPKPKIPSNNPRIHLFMRRTGEWMEKQIEDIIRKNPTGSTRVIDFVNQVKTL